MALRKSNKQQEITDSSQPTFITGILFILLYLAEKSNWKNTVLDEHVYFLAFNVKNWGVELSIVFLQKDSLLQLHFLDIFEK